MDLYHAVVDLTDIDGRPAAKVDVTATASSTVLTFSHNLERGCASLTVDLFNPDEADEVWRKVRMAAVRQRQAQVEAGGPF